jgi:adenylylsulfate kinase
MKNIKILVMGLPGSGKTTLSDKLGRLLNAKRVNADEIRKRFNDWDFSLEGRIRQAKRMNMISDKEKIDNIVVTDFICPTKEARKNFNADYIIWMNTIKTGKFDDTNQMFEKPSAEEMNFEVKEKNADKYKLLIFDELKKLF